MQVNYNSYKALEFECPTCKWKGKGSALSLGDFSEAHCIGDLECPNCGKMLAFWQAPLINDVDDDLTKH